MTVLEGKGVNVDYKELVKSTVMAQVDVLTDEDVDIMKFNDLKMRFKDGCDRAGWQTTWKSKAMKSC